MGRNNADFQSGSGRAESFETVNPDGPNSLYTRLPDNRWARDKKATGETHIEDHTLFVHPAYGEQDYPRGEKGAKYSPLVLALTQGDLIHPSGKVGIRIADPNKSGNSTLHSVPDEHVSREPKPGWHVVEYSRNPDGSLASYHLGHPVAPLNKGNYRA